jgi:hypothetical protein
MITDEIRELQRRKVQFSAKASLLGVQERIKLSIKARRRQGKERRREKDEAVERIHARQASSPL